MSVSGMTGFARAEGEAGGVRWLWEVRSVNGRGLDIKSRLPTGFEALETAVREACGARFRRGSLQLTLSLRRETQSAAAAAIDHAFLAAILAETAPYVARGEAAAPRMDGLLQLRGAFLSPDAPLDLAATPGLQAALVAGLATALDGLAAARRAEGATLARLLSDILAKTESLVGDAGFEAAAAPEALRARLVARLTTLAPDVTIDPQRLAQEAALLASKADIREELDRLTAHIAEARALLAAAEPAGRKLDFLSQELNREANTLCSKASELALTRIGLELKSCIEQFREQSANVE